MSPDRPGRVHNADAEEDVCAHATSNDRLDARMGNIRGRCAKSRIDSLSAENARNRLLEKASHRRAHCRTSPRLRRRADHRASTRGPCHPCAFCESCLDVADTHSRGISR